MLYSEFDFFLATADVRVKPSFIDRCHTAAVPGREVFLPAALAEQKTKRRRTMGKAVTFPCLHSQGRHHAFRRWNVVCSGSFGCGQQANCKELAVFPVVWAWPGSCHKGQFLSVSWQHCAAFSSFHRVRLELEFRCWKHRLVYHEKSSAMHKFIYEFVFIQNKKYQEIRFLEKLMIIAAGCLIFALTKTGECISPTFLFYGVSQVRPLFFISLFLVTSARSFRR